MTFSLCCFIKVMAAVLTSCISQRLMAPFAAWKISAVCSSEGLSFLGILLTGGCWTIAREAELVERLLPWIWASHWGYGHPHISHITCWNTSSPPLKWLRDWVQVRIVHFEIPCRKLFNVIPTQLLSVWSSSMAGWWEGRSDLPLEV